MPTVAISIDGTDITADVVFDETRFKSLVNGKPGDAHLRVRDLDSTYSFNEGDDLLLAVDGEAAWRGYVTKIERTYIYPAGDVAESGLQRFWDIEGADLNLLFTRRVVAKTASPTTVQGTQFAAGTADTVAITELLTNWLDLSSDNLDTTSGVVGVGDLDPAQVTQAWSGGWYWANAMDSIAMLPAAIYYLRPEMGSPRGTLVYCDTDVPTAPFGLSDTPNGTTTRGFREMEIIEDGTSLANDVLAWGMGYGSQTPVFVRDEDAASQAAHGLWQTSVIKPGVYKQTTINRIADSILNGSPSNHRGAKDDRPAVRLVTYEPGLLAGHVVTFTSNVWSWTDAIPVRQMEITFEAPDVPRYELLLSHEIDAPWSFIDQFWPTIPKIDPPPPPPPPPPPACPDACLVASCTVDPFDRTIAAPDWEGNWGTITSTAAGGGVTPGVANIADVASWAITRTVATQTEQATRRLSLSECSLTPQPFEYIIAFTADAAFDSYVAYDTLGSPPPGTYNFPGLYYNDSGTLRTEAQQYLEFLFYSTAYSTNGDNRTKIRVTTVGGVGYWSMSAGGAIDTYQLPTSFSFTAGHTYAIRVKHSTTSVMAKLWDMASSEPQSWPYTNSTSSVEANIRPTSFEVKFARGMQGGTGTVDPAASYTFNPVQIDLVCGNFGSETSSGPVDGTYVIDDFQRLVASGWGTASSGNAWSKTAISGTTTELVNGSEGEITTTGGASQITDMILTTTAYATGKAWVEIRWLVTTTVESSPDDIVGGVYNSTFTQGLTWFTDGTGLRYGRPGFSQLLLNSSGGTFTVPLGVPFWVAVRGDWGTSEIKAKVWLASETEPDWNTTSVWIGLLTAASIVRCLVRAGSSTAETGTRYFDYIVASFPGGAEPDFATSPCIDGEMPGTFTNTPLGGFGCEDVTRLSSTTFQTSQAFQPSSTFVWRDGLFQRRGTDYIEGSDHRTLTFSDAVSTTSTIRVCYFAEGVTP